MSFSFRHGDVAVHITVEPDAGGHDGCRLPGSPATGEAILYPPLHADLVLPVTDPGDAELHYRPGLGSWRSGLGEGDFAGIPYGLLGRHLVMFLCTEAFRCRSRTITLQPHRLYSFLAGLGSLSESTVGAGWFTELEAHLNRTLRHGWINEETGGAGFLVSGRSRQTRGFLDSSSECPPVITLEAEFAKSALRWIPLDADVVRLLSRRSCLALDVYVWLTLVGTYLDEARPFPWPALITRFGTPGEDPAGFRARFEACLSDIGRVTPLPPVSVDTPGIEIRPASSCVGSFHRAWPLPR